MPLPTHKLPSIDFEVIRTHRGTQHGGFEELTVSLFRHEQGEPFSVTRVDGAGGDGGVEAYVRQGNGNVVGLQAKYFRKLGPSQWSQIRSSLEGARKTFPKLRTYYVAAPLALSPAQAKRWEQLKRLARRLKPSLKLIWWGESELIDLLTQSAHRGRASYWFGTTQFDGGWIDRHNEQARADLDTRYTPSQHVRVATEGVLDAFARSPEFTRLYYERARRVWISWRASVDLQNPSELSAALGQTLSAARVTGEIELPRFGDGLQLPAWSDVLGAIEKLHQAYARIAQELARLRKEAAETDKQRNVSEDIAKRNRYERISYNLHQVEKALDELLDFRGFVEEHNCVACQFLLVQGEAGAGKSHLLATFVETLRSRQQCALFLLGEYFTTSGEPWSQLIQRLCWTGSRDELLSALNYAGEVISAPTVIVIDALNESMHRETWSIHLSAFANELKSWPWIRLVVSCRTDFMLITLPDAIASNRAPEWAVTHHPGYGEVMFDAIIRYFAAYHVKTRDFPPLLPEFENPLFLKTFSEAFENTEIPVGPLTLDRVMQRRIDVACHTIKRAIDCPNDTTRAALNWLAGRISVNHGRAIPLTEARQAIDALFPGHGQSRSLYQHLRSSGLITEVVCRDHKTKASEVHVRFAFERFSDYFISNLMLTNIGDVNKLRAEWKKRHYSTTWDNIHDYHRNRGLLKSLAILIPERYGIELGDLLKNRTIRRYVLKDFLSSLAWRGAASITTRSQAHLLNAQRMLPLQEVLSALLRIAPVPGHPWNADYLHKQLKPMLLPVRDRFWTITISDMFRYDANALPDLMVRWLFNVPHDLISEEQARLTSRLLAWFFSSNDRGFRHRATIAAIRLLQNRTLIAAHLVDDFYDVNDPYIFERVMAVAAGVAIRERVAGKLAPLAKVIWERMFKPRYIYAHILIRDYGRTVMATANEHGELPPGVEDSSFKPPYRSKWPQIWSEKKSRAWGNQEGWSEIVHSIEPDRGGGGYGDFGRYVMQSRMREWLNVPRNAKYPSNDEGKEFDSLLARRWVLQRVVELGWTPERFSAYEKLLLHGRQSGDIEEVKQERISKKYQWIALTELEALVSDRFHLACGWAQNKRLFEGAWQLFSRDFDPAQPLTDPIKRCDDTETQRTIGRELRVPDWWVCYPDPFADKKLLRDRSAWVCAMPDDFGVMLQIPNVPGMAGDALMLACWQTWEEPDPYPPRKPGDGVPQVFVHARAWIVPGKRLSYWLRFLRTTHFWGDGVMLPAFGRASLGDYPWAKQFANFREACANQDRFGREFRLGLAYAACSYSDGRACLPSPQVVELLGAKWSGHEFDFVDATGALVAISPRPERKSNSAPCLVTREKLIAALKAKGLTLIWGMVGERHCFDYETSEHIADAAVTFSAVYWLDDKGNIRGGISQREVTKIPKDQASRDQPFPRVRERIRSST